MKKNILGLDLGTNSIGWAHVTEGETADQSTIEQIGVRVNPLTIDEQTNFEKGKPITTNADRTLKRGARRNLNRYKLRRSNLLEILLNSNIINANSTLTEDGPDTTHATWKLRALAATEKIELDEFARVLFAINKKRGYKSSRKAKNEDEGQAIDGMAIARKLYEENLTPGQLTFRLLQKGSKSVPEFYRSDLQAELDAIWNYQKMYHPEILTDSFYLEIKGKGQKATSSLFWINYKFNPAEIKDLDDSLKNEMTINFNNREIKRFQAYKWRCDSLSTPLEKEQLAYVITEINSNLNNSSGYLGAISDRSKELYFNEETVGQYLYRQLKKNPHTSLKNQVFYRQDYLDEFEKIWETQAGFYTQLTHALKEEIRDVIIFYQRRLKSQKGLISFCEFESREILIDIDGKKVRKQIGLKVAPKSSPLFQEFKIWQNLNNVEFRRKGIRRKKTIRTNKTDETRDCDSEFVLDLDAKQLLFDELNIKGNLNSKTIIELLGHSAQEWEMNYTQLEGNRTQQALYEAYFKIIENAGYDLRDYLKVKSNKDEIELQDINIPAAEIKKAVSEIFTSMGIDVSILDFDAELTGQDFEKQTSYRLWHLLYSYEGDNSNSGNEKLYELLEKKFGFAVEHAKVLSNINFQGDYGNLSSKAMRKIFPFIKESKFNEACELAKYRHSKHSLTKEELDNRVLKDMLELLPKNSLRNPVVEKILNQMINVVNTLILKNSEKDAKGNVVKYFHFDEIRIELARELKKNAKERAEMTNNINAAKIEYEKIEKLLQKEFGVLNPTRNDIIRYRLYEELKINGYKDLYTNTYIPKELLFSKQIDIEHIIPQSRLFDDSFSNKTIVFRKDNIKKGNMTAFDYIESGFDVEELNDYKTRVENLFNSKIISKAKYKKLLLRESEIGDGFIERDLRDTQYIAKKAKEILFTVTKSVVSTTGAVTDRLREDWGLINVMKEMNLPKYRALGLTELEERKYGQKVEVIKDWTKRNDHRHHAMDALTVAFTKHSYIQYLNYLNARKDERHKMHWNIISIENKETEMKIDEAGEKKRVFKEPIPNFRQLAKEHLEQVFISHKSKNKVVTKSKNIIKGNPKVQKTLTPRGQLHKETVYGRYRYYESKDVKINASFDKEAVNKVANPQYRKLLFERLEANGFDSKKAFTGRNALSKNPIYLDDAKSIAIPETVKLVWLEEDFSIRKDITPDNFKDVKLIDKVLDAGIRQLLKARLESFSGDAKKAFAGLDKNPIWLNKEKGISVKRVTISGVKNAEALHYKKNHFGNLILDENGKKIPVDFVSTGNNHHVAIYRDENGNLQEKVVSFFEAVERVNQGLPVIDKTFNRSMGWQFLFTMKQNELFVFPNEKTGFNPAEIDLLDPKNRALISPNLFRVQKIATKDYFLRHHLETTVENVNELKETTWKRLGVNGMSHVVKVRTNHLGEIISIGEY